MVLKRGAVGIAFLAALTMRCFSADPLVGRWEGPIHVPGNELTLVVDLASDSAGAGTGSVLFPGVGIKRVTVKKLGAERTGPNFAHKRGAARGVGGAVKRHTEGRGEENGEIY